MERDLIESGAGRGEYVTYREHMTAKEEAQERFAALELHQATMHAALMHIPEKLDKLTEAVAAMGNKPAQQPDHMALQMVRAVDELAKLRSQPTPISEIVQLLQSKQGGSGKTWALVGALGAVVAILGSFLLLP